MVSEIVVITDFQPITVPANPARRTAEQERELDRIESLGARRGRTISPHEGFVDVTPRGMEESDERAAVSANVDGTGIVMIARRRFSLADMVRELLHRPAQQQAVNIETQTLAPEPDGVRRVLLGAQVGEFMATPSRQVVRVGTNIVVEAMVVRRSVGNADTTSPAPNPGVLTPVGSR